MIGVQKNVSLKPYNTFRIDAKARLFAEITSVEELEELLGEPTFKNEKLLVVGLGANILFTKDFDGLVLKMGIEGISVVHEDAKRVVVKVGAGHVWDDFVAYAVENSWAGMESMAKIPGTVGGAVVGNAGAYGAETKDHLDTVEVLDRQNLTVTSLQKEECGFAYRDSNFKNQWKDRYIVLSATFVLEKKKSIPLDEVSHQSVKTELEKLGKTEFTPKKIYDCIVAIRKVLPDITKVGSAGSVFANPIVAQGKLDELLAKYPDMPNFDVTAGTDNGKRKLSIGWLLEQQGWKNKRIGNVSTMPNHANIVFADGPATGKELLSFFDRMRDDCETAYGIKIMPEILIV